ncbi:MAG TPA: bifunctional phosphopantothenoylcysteine decarboxylase/phosphopantothenate--cysteine ligase CoaBC [Sediminibacterium sp.]|nr:bifunctional phosphopantothenoylcysteine decarboxylase/phosphopantothenate--cysteine ligase CoaBC [Sediminibacterium sp.]
MLRNKKILIAVSGSIAAYKIPYLVRLLIKEGAEVKLIMTRAATDFVTPLVLSTLSKNKVITGFVEEDVWTDHVMLGRWPDVFLVAPLSANTLSKMATGVCDHILLATYLSATCPVAVAPAMDEDMWKHPATGRNLQQLVSDGVQVIPPGIGELASGLSGEGRMAEPEEMLCFLKEHFFRTSALQGKKILVTAGPTYEPIDPVRFIGNRSSGKMGFAIARSLYEHGASVTLITGPTNEKAVYQGIEVIHIESAEELLEACKRISVDADIMIMNAAVADFTPASIAGHKIKKTGADLHLALRPTTDIAAWLGSNKKANQLLIGFALETDNEINNAKAKLHKKNLDAVILNSLNDPGAGFGTDTNTITIIDHGQELNSGNRSKSDIATFITSYLIEKINNQ